MIRLLGDSGVQLDITFDNNEYMDYKKKLQFRAHIIIYYKVDYDDNDWSKRFEATSEVSFNAALEKLSSEIREFMKDGLY